MEILTGRLHRFGSPRPHTPVTTCGVLFALGCTVDPVPESTTSDPPSTSSELAQQLGCEAGLNPFLDIQVEPTAIANVPRLTWQSDQLISPWSQIDVGRAELLQSEPAELAALEGEHLLLGIPVLRESLAILLAETPEGLGCSEPIELSPAPLEAGLPELSLTSNGSSDGYTILSVLTENEDHDVIVDSYGEYVWTRNAGSGAHSRTIFSDTEPSILSLTWAEDATGDGTILRLGLDGRPLEAVKLQGIHTDFVELPSGQMASIAWELRDFVDPDGEVQTVLGDRIIESTSGGGQEIIWSAFDDFVPDLEQSLPSGSYPADSSVLDWSHVNGLSYDAEGDAYLVSADGLNALLRIDRQTGERLWMLSDTEGDFSSTDKARLIHGAHSAEDLGSDRILVFNRNVSYPMEGKDLEAVCSEAVEIELDSASGSAHRVWSYGSDTCLLTVFYGEAMRLENDHTLVIFSSSGQVSESNPQGETVWQLNAEIGAAFGFGDRVSSLY